MVALTSNMVALSSLSLPCRSISSVTLPLSVYCMSLSVLRDCSAFLSRRALSLPPASLALGSRSLHALSCSHVLVLSPFFVHALCPPVALFVCDGFSLFSVFVALSSLLLSSFSLFLPAFSVLASLPFLPCLPFFFSISLHVLSSCLFCTRVSFYENDR